MRHFFAATLLLPATLALAQTPSQTGDAAIQTPAASTAAAETREPTTNPVIDAAANKVTHPPTIDGTINDDEWKEAAEFTGMVDAQDGSPAPEPALFWLGYDDKYIYFAARLHDSQPSAIKCTEYRQNSSLTGDDTAQLDIDPFGALTDWSHFAINPKGATSINIAGGRASKEEWIGEFVAKARITSDGWEAEARIPWALMKLPGAGAHEIRFDFDRYMARKNRYYDFTNTVGGDLRGVGDWKNVQLPKVDDDRILQLLPYSYQGVDPNGKVANAGLDLKMPVGQQMTLVGTANPDFRNIENQILSIDFSRFARLAAESRPFFQEGSQYYGSALIATQMVHDFDTGLNIYGKVNNKLAMGLINTANFGQENDLMSTWQYSPTQLTTVRFSNTDLSTPGSSNKGYLLAISNQATKNLNVFVRGMSTQDTTSGDGEERTAQVNYQKNETMANLSWEQFSPNFLPRLGFVPEVDLKGLNGFAQWDHQIKSGPMQELLVDTYGTKYDHFAGGDYRRETGGDFNVALRNNLLLTSNLDFAQFEGSDDHTMTLGVVNPRSNPYRNWSANYTFGRIEDADYRSIVVGTAYRPMEKLQCTLSAQFVHHLTDQKQIIFSENYDLGNNRAISGRLVQSGSNINAYAALQRSGGAGVEYFLILGDPNALTFRRSLILKVTYPLQMFMSKHSH